MKAFMVCVLATCLSPLFAVAGDDFLLPHETPVFSDDHDFVFEERTSVIEPEEEVAHNPEPRSRWVVTEWGVHEIPPAEPISNIEEYLALKEAGILPVPMENFVPKRNNKGKIVTDAGKNIIMERSQDLILDPMPSPRALFIINERVDLEHIPNKGLSAENNRRLWAALEAFMKEGAPGGKLQGDVNNILRRFMYGEPITFEEARIAAWNIYVVREEWRRQGKAIVAAISRGEVYATEADAHAAAIRLAVEETKATEDLFGDKNETASSETATPPKVRVRKRVE